MAETGHAKNVENWQKMIAACTGFGSAYNPNPDQDRNWRFRLC